MFQNAKPDQPRSRRRRVELYFVTDRPVVGRLGGAAGTTRCFAKKDMERSAQPEVQEGARHGQEFRFAGTTFKPAPGAEIRSLRIEARVRPDGGVDLRCDSPRKRGFTELQAAVLEELWADGVWGGCGGRSSWAASLEAGELPLAQEAAAARGLRLELAAARPEPARDA